MSKDPWDQLVRDCAAAQPPHVVFRDPNGRVLQIFPLALVEEMAGGKIDMSGYRGLIVRGILLDWLRRLREEAKGDNA